MVDSKVIHPTNKQHKVTTGSIRDVSGAVTIAAGDVSQNISIHNATSGMSVAELKKLFDQLYTAIETNTKTSPSDKDDLKSEVKEIQATVNEATKRNEKVDENFIARHFRNIARMAPDILDVVVATLGNPLAGLGVAAKKIAEKAKESLIKQEIDSGNHLNDE